jgi:hypothetical protein
MLKGRGRSVYKGLDEKMMMIMALGDMVCENVDWDSAG